MTRGSNHTGNDRPRQAKVPVTRRADAPSHLATDRPRPCIAAVTWKQRGQGTKAARPPCSIDPLGPPSVRDSPRAAPSPIGGRRRYRWARRRPRDLGAATADGSSRGDRLGRGPDEADAAPRSQGGKPIEPHGRGDDIKNRGINLGKSQWGIARLEFKVTKVAIHQVEMETRRQRPLDSVVIARP